MNQAQCWWRPVIFFQASVVAVTSGIVLDVSHRLGIVVCSRWNFIEISVALVTAACLFFALALLDQRRIGRVYETERRRETEKIAARRPAESFAKIEADQFTISLGPAIGGQILTADSADTVLEVLNDMRKTLARETGIVIFGLHLLDDPSLPAYAVRAEIDGVCIAETNQLGAGETETIESAIALFTAFCATTARENLHALFSLQTLEATVAHAWTKCPALMRYVGTETLSTMLLFHVYEALLKEAVWPRNPIGLFEVLLRETESRKPVALWLYHHSNYERTEAEITRALKKIEDPLPLIEAARRYILPRQFQRAGIETIEYYHFDGDFRRRIMSAPTITPQTFEALKMPVSAIEMLRAGGVILSEEAERATIEKYLRHWGLANAVHVRAEFPATVTLTLRGKISEVAASGTNIRVLPNAPYYVRRLEHIDCVCRRRNRCVHGLQRSGCIRF